MLPADRYCIFLPVWAKYPYFWRDNTGNEIDLLIDQRTALRPVEIKSGATLVPDWLKGIRRWQRLAGDQALKPWLIYGGGDSYARDGIEVLSWLRVSDR